MGLKKILKEHLVDPVLRLRETHLNLIITEKGYEMLLDNAVEEIEKQYKRRAK
jgi:hypothetical protein